MIRRQKKRELVEEIDEDYSSILKRCRISSTPGEIRLLKDVKEARRTMKNIIIEHTDRPNVVLIKFPSNVVVAESTNGYFMHNEIPVQAKDYQPLNASSYSSSSCVINQSFHHNTAIEMDRNSVSRENSLTSTDTAGWDTSCRTFYRNDSLQDIIAFSNTQLQATTTSFQLDDWHCAGNENEMNEEDFMPHEDQYAPAGRIMPTTNQHPFQLQLPQEEESHLQDIFELPSVFAVSVSKFYPHACPEVRCLNDHEGDDEHHRFPQLAIEGGSCVAADGTIHHPLLSEQWSALFGLRDVLIMLIGIRECLLAGKATTATTSSPDSCHQISRTVSDDALLAHKRISESGVCSPLPKRRYSMGSPIAPPHMFANCRTTTGMSSETLGYHPNTGTDYMLNMEDARDYEIGLCVPQSPASSFLHGNIHRATGISSPALHIFNSSGTQYWSSQDLTKLAMSSSEIDIALDSCTGNDEMFMDCDGQYEPGGGSDFIGGIDYQPTGGVTVPQVPSTMPRISSRSRLYGFDASSSSSSVMDRNQDW